MKYSPQQEEAFRLIKGWYNGGEKRPFVLNGFAGTGKTTIAKNIGDLLDIDRKEIIYVAYTGKAAQQLRLKGCDDATTVHKLLYSPVEKSGAELERLENLLLQMEVEGASNIVKHDVRMMIKNEKSNLKKVKFEIKPDLARILRSKIILVDESSMINLEVAQDLEATGLPVIYSGDTFQLPPFKGFSPIASITPDITLTEVHRQGLENPVLAFATRIRKGEWFGTEELIETNGDQRLHILNRSKCNYELYDQHDQIICGFKKTRWEFNRKMQAKKILEGKVKKKDTIEVGIGDRIMFLKNDYDNDICNGAIGYVEDIDRIDISDPHVQYPHKFWKITGRTDDTIFEKYKVNNEVILKPPHKDNDTPREQHIDLAYAITCHKSQGSEWGSVFVNFEGVKGWNMSRWLYTAATRARTRLTISVPAEEGLR